MVRGSIPVRKPGPVLGDEVVVGTTRSARDGEEPSSGRDAPAAFRVVVTNVAGLLLHARVAEPPAIVSQRPPIGMVHGLGLPGRYTMPTATELDRSYRVHVPDLPGFGDSGRPRRTLDVGGLAAGLAAWMEAAR